MTLCRPSEECLSIGMKSRAFMILPNKGVANASFFAAAEQPGWCINCLTLVNECVYREVKNNYTRNDKIHI